MWRWYRRLQPRARVSLLLGTLGVLVVVLFLWSAARMSSEGEIKAAQMQESRASFGFGGRAGGGGMAGARMATSAPPMRAPAMAPVTTMPRAGFESEEVPTSRTVYTAAWPTQMLVRTAQLRLQVKDVAEASADIARLARLAGGYVADAAMNAEARSSAATITIRVPNEGMDGALDQIGQLGKLLERTVSAQEVTEEYVDLTSRRRNLQREELRLLDLLNRAGRVSDLLEVEQEVARVRGEIEAISGRMHYLENRVAFSTISVKLEGPHFKAAPPRSTWAARTVLKQAWESLRDTGRGLATLLIWVGMFAPVWLPILALVGWLVRREARRHASG